MSERKVVDLTEADLKELIAKLIQTHDELGYFGGSSLKINLERHKETGQLSKIEVRYSDWPYES